MACSPASSGSQAGYFSLPPLPPPEETGPHGTFAKPELLATAISGKDLHYLPRLIHSHTTPPPPKPCGKPLTTPEHPLPLSQRFTSERARWTLCLLPTCGGPTLLFM